MEKSIADHISAVGCAFWSGCSYADPPQQQFKQFFRENKKTYKALGSKDLAHSHTSSVVPHKSGNPQ